MSKDVIHVGGEDVVVREDTAKSYRGVIWALGSIGIILVVTAIILFFVLFRAVTDDKPAANPANAERNAR
jgi:heme/copper-type cytochrome/quinol oxidase subunit 2